MPAVSDSRNSNVDRQSKTILVLIKGLGVGGAEKLISEGARFWNRQQFEFHVAYILPWKNELVDDLEQMGIKVSCIGGKAGLDVATPFRLRRLVRAENVRLIHAHLPTAGIVARTIRGVPVVYTEHNLANSYRPITRILNRFTYNRNRSVAAVSEAVRRSLTDYPGPDPIVIDNGVSVQVSEAQRSAARVELGLGPTDPLVVHVGNIRPHKGHLTLLEAAQVILDGSPDTSIVSIGGEKRSGDLDRLRTEARERGLDDRMRFLGRRLDAQSFIAAADVFVNPSDVEGLPVAVLEAQALGVPVVATRVGGVPSIVSDRETGLLVEPGNPNQVAEAVLGLLRSHDGGKQIAERAKRRISERYGLDRMVRAYECVYQSILDEG